MAQEINLTLTGYRAEDKLPEESGHYVVILEYTGGVWELSTLPYSTKHHAWNATDDITEEQAKEWKSNRVTHWFRLPEAPEQKEEANERQ